MPDNKMNVIHKYETTSTTTSLTAQPFCNSTTPSPALNESIPLPLLLELINFASILTEATSLTIVPILMFELFSNRCFKVVVLPLPHIIYKIYIVNIRYYNAIRNNEKVTHQTHHTSILILTFQGTHSTR